MNAFYLRFGKRALDLVIAAIATIVFAPAILIVTLLVRWKLGSPVLFSEQRAGQGGQPFTVYKFRSMTDERDENGELLPDEARLTSFGRKLRSTSLDELPQLLNIFRGDMSFVGPRPLSARYTSRYNEFQKRRLEVEQGLTGWAQINGRNAVTWSERFEMDVWYVENRSFWLDMRILLATLATPFRRQGISSEGHVTMPEFLGEDSDPQRDQAPEEANSK